MPTPIEKIRSGLDSRERAKKTPGKAKLAALAAVPGDIPSLKTLRLKTATTLARLQKLKDAAVSAMAEHRAKVVAEYDELGYVANDNGIGRQDLLGKDKRKSLIDKKVAALQKELSQESKAERAELMAVLTEAGETIRLAKPAFASAVGLLMRGTLSSKDRATYTANLAHAGPVELSNAMQEAVRSNDRALAAACITRYDSLGKGNQNLVTFNKQDIAEAMTGEDYLAASEAIGMTEYNLSLGRLHEKEALGAQISASAKIGTGVILKNLETKLGYTIDMRSDEEKAEAGDNPPGETLEERLDRKFPGKPGTGAAMAAQGAVIPDAPI